MFFKINLNGTVLDKINNVNPSLSGDKCFWSAVECSKVLLDDDYNPLDVSTIAANQDAACHSLIKRNCEKKPKTITSKGALFEYLELAPKNTVMIITNSEGDHYYNILKNANGNCYIIDADRRSVWDLKTEEDLIHSIVGWNEDKEEVKFDYFRCQVIPQYIDSEDSENSSEFKADQKQDDDISSLKIFTMSTTLLHDDFKPVLNTTLNEPEDIYRDIDDFYNY